MAPASSAVSSDVIFQTPDNRTFYSTSPYVPLATETQQIRLLKTRTGTEDCLDEYELLQPIALREVKGKFTALSYCAGSLDDPGAILVNGLRFNVFANLRHALEEFHRYWQRTLAQEDCLVWVDQICINQNDVEERTAQVRVMRNIYSHATQVFVCLSTTSKTCSGLSWLLRLAQTASLDSIDSSSIQTLTAEHSVSAERKTVASERHAGNGRDRADRITRILRRRLCDDAFVEGWLAFYDVVDAPWWGRAWVLQELMVSSQAVFAYAGIFVALETLSPLLMSFCTMHAQLIKDFRKLKGQNEVQSAHADGQRNIRRIVDRLDQGRSQVSIDNIKFMIDHKATWSGTIDLKELLAHSRYLEASNPRDKVFSLIGLADVVYRDLPDYSQELATVLTRTTAAIIMHENSLEVLTVAMASCARSKRIVPSWVVDCTVKELAGEKRGKHLGSQVFRSRTDSSRQRADASFLTLHTRLGPWEVLQVSASYMSTLVRESIELVDTEEPVQLWRVFITSTGVGVLTSRSSKPLDQLWMLNGCERPMVLRKQGVYGHRLVSDAWILRHQTRSCPPERESDRPAGSSRISIL